MRVRNGRIAAARPIDVDEQQCERQPGESPGATADDERGIPHDSTEGARVLEDRERPQRELKQSEGQEHVDAQCGQGPRPRARSGIEGDGDRTQDCSNSHEESQHQPAPPVSSQPHHHLGEPQLLRLGEGHRAVHDRCRDGAEQDEEKECRANRQARKDDSDQDRGEQRIQHDQPPGLMVEIRRCDPKCAREAHPLTPEAATPATK